jgi:hypothetical protein
MPTEIKFEEGAGVWYACQVVILIPNVSEGRGAWTGPDDPGGKQAHYDVELRVFHRAYELGDQEGMDAEDDHDRIIDALKDCVRGKGRDLGRPDVILTAGEYPKEANITSEHDDPWINAGVVERWSRIFFTVSQYMQRQP